MNFIRYLCVVITIVICGQLRKHHVAGQHFKHIRSSPTDKLPFPILKEDENSENDPRPRDIDDHDLRGILGLDYLPEFMSPYQPGDFYDSAMVRPLPERIPIEIRKLFKPTARSRKLKKSWKKIQKNKRIIQAWLHQETACPVRYRWKDLGIRFWPRFIKEGFCDSSKSCSIPAGMKCKSSAQSSIKLLRWYCQGILEERKYCLWIEVQYPVISKCTCQC